MEYNAINMALVLFEDAVLNNKVDQLMTRDLLFKALQRISGHESLDHVRYFDRDADIIIQALKTNKLKALIQSDRFQKLYDITNELSPALSGGADEFFKLPQLEKIGRLKEWKSFVDLDQVKEIRAKYELHSLAKALLLENLIALNLPREVLRYFCGEFTLTETEHSIHVLYRRASDLDHYITITDPSSEVHPQLPTRTTTTESLDFKIWNKVVHFDYVNQFSETNIKRHLKKYLKTDKVKVIEGTLKFSRQLTGRDFIANNGSWFVAHCYTLLYDYIFEKECELYNYYFEQKRSNSEIYHSLIKRCPSLCIEPEELFLFYVIAGSRETDIRNFYNNNYAAIWHSYVDTLIADKSSPATMGIANRLRERLALSLLSSVNTDQAIDSISLKPPKEKLPCDNYLYAALLYEKSLKTDVEFLPLCREASKKYYSKKGKEFSGEQLANVFYQELKKYDNFPDFCKPEHNGQRMKRLKKEINWLQS